MPTDRAARAFFELAELPPDVDEAFEAYKLAILRHRLSGWYDVTQENVLLSLDALKEMATVKA